METKNILSWALLAIASLAIGVLVSLLVACPVMLLWNAVIPTIFGLITIDFGQALALSLLCSILFKSSSSTH